LKHALIFLKNKEEKLFYNSRDYKFKIKTPTGSKSGEDTFLTGAPSRGHHLSEE
jgi:hypothetical protein